jgi:hypothetical protein
MILSVARFWACEEKCRFAVSEPNEAFFSAEGR